MLVRHANQNDQIEWLRMRAALWPDCPLEDHHSEMQEQLDDPARYAVFVVERDTGKLGGFLEASLRRMPMAAALVRSGTLKAGMLMLIYGSRSWAGNWSKRRSSGPSSRAARR